jgi:menaquinone-dependent protoporphyrinogen oxidase
MKILIAYRTQYGAVEKCALIMRGKLLATVELLDLKQKRNPEIGDFDIILIGGSIYEGLIQREVISFCGRNRETLLEKKVGLFLCCLDKRERSGDQLNSSYPPWLTAHAFVSRSLGGILDLEKLLPMDCYLVNKLDDIKKSGDLLDYDGLDDFCQKVNRIDSGRAMYPTGQSDSA